MHRHIRDRKENTLVTDSSFFSFFLFFLLLNNTLFYLTVQVLYLIEHGFYDLHIGIHDWPVTVVRWLFMHLS